MGNEAVSAGGQRHEGGEDVATLVRRLDDVTSALEELTEVLGQEEDLSVILDRVCRQTAHAIPGADMVSVTLLREDGPVTGAATVQRAVDVDIAQYRAEQGPCLEAASSGEVQRTVVAEMRHEWPVFAEAAERLGVGSFLSAPLSVDEDGLGSLNLYGEQTHGFRELDAALLELYTTAVEAALHNARRYVRAREQTTQLRQALVSRALIDQAKGIVMAVHRVPEDEAFAMLVDRSQRDNLKLRDLAERFVNDASGSADREADPVEPDDPGEPGS